MHYCGDLWHTLCARASWSLSQSEKILVCKEQYLLYRKKRNSLFLRECGPSAATEAELEQSEDDGRDVEAADDINIVVDLATDDEDDGNNAEDIF